MGIKGKSKAMARKLFTLIVLTFIGAVACAEEAVMPPTLPSMACAQSRVSDYCRWSQKELLAREQQIVAKAIHGIKRTIIPYLKHNNAVWVPLDVNDPTNPKIEAYCTDKLTALRKGRGRYFPPPQQKSFELVGKTFSAEKIPYITWRYVTPGGKSEMYLSITGGENYLEGALSLGNTHFNLRNRAVNEKKNRPASGGFFKEQAYGVVEISGELFGIEGGVIYMDDSPYWRNDIYQVLVDEYEYLSPLKSKNKFSSAQKKSYHETGIWPAPMLALYPLNPPWRNFYRELNIPEGIHLEDGDPNYGKPCMWNIRH